MFETLNSSEYDYGKCCLLGFIHCFNCTFLVLKFYLIQIEAAVFHSKIVVVAVVIFSELK